MPATVQCPRCGRQLTVSDRYPLGQDPDFLPVCAECWVEVKDEDISRNSEYTKKLPNYDKSLLASQEPPEAAGG